MKVIHVSEDSKFGEAPFAKFWLQPKILLITISPWFEANPAKKDKKSIEKLGTKNLYKSNDIIAQLNSEIESKSNSAQGKRILDSYNHTRILKIEYEKKMEENNVLLKNTRDQLKQLDESKKYPIIINNKRPLKGEGCIDTKK